jgi:hypothetical protein
METTASNAQTEQDQTNKPNIDFSHRSPVGVEDDSLRLRYMLENALGRIEALADLMETACLICGNDSFDPNTLWRTAQTIRFESKDARAILDAYAEKAEAQS